MWQQVERLAPLTGQNPVPPEKRSEFRYDPDKFAAGHFTPVASEAVAAARAKECPIHLKAVPRKVDVLDARLAELGGRAAVEVEITRVHVRKDLIIKENYVAAERGQPLIYDFRHYFSLGERLGKTFRAEV